MNHLAHEICGGRTETPFNTIQRACITASSGHSDIAAAAVAATDIVAVVVVADVVVAVAAVAVVVAAVAAGVAAVVAADAGVGIAAVGIAAAGIAAAGVAAVGVGVAAVVDIVVFAADPEGNALEKGTALAADAVPSVERGRNTMRKEANVHNNPRSPRHEYGHAVRRTTLRTTSAMREIPSPSQETI